MAKSSSEKYPNTPLDASKFIDGNNNMWDLREVKPDDVLPDDVEHYLQKDFKAELLAERNLTLRTKMARFLVDETYLNQDQADEVMRQADIRDKALEKIYFSLGGQRALAVSAIQSEYVKEEEATETILKSISDQIIEEFLIVDRSTADHLLKWWKIWTRELSDQKAYDKVNGDFEDAKKKWDYGRLSKAAKDAWTEEAKAKRAERIQKSETVRIKKITFNLAETEKILKALRKEKGNQKSHNNGYWPDEVYNANWGGWCATGVCYIMSSACGLYVTGNGYAWEGNMRTLIASKTVSYEQSDNPDDKLTPPESSVLVWNSNGQNHVAVVVEGQWVSDFISTPGHQMGRKDGSSIDPDWVFVPVDPDSDKPAW